MLIYIQSCYLLMKTHTDTRRPHLDFHLCLHSSLASYCTEEINLANQAVFILAPVLAWPCTNLHLVFWAQPQTCFQLLKLTWLPPDKAFTHSVFFDDRDLLRPLTPPTVMGNSLLRHLQRQDLSPVSPSLPATSIRLSQLLLYSQASSHR